MFQDRPDRDEIALAGWSSVGKPTLMRELTSHSKFTAGKKPGATRKPNYSDWNAEKFIFTDLLGSGFMSSVDRDTRKAIKTDVVQYAKEHVDGILAAVLVVDEKSAIDITGRHTTEDPIPHDVEMFFFLDELDIPTVVAVNKMDKASDRDGRLNDLCDRFGLLPLWKQWRNVIAPITVKRGDISHLEDALRSHLHEQGRDDPFKFL